MQHYDVIIVGGGIAGTGLAYNLSRICPGKSVLLIEKNKVGGNAAYGYRMILDKERGEYDVPYEYRYKGLGLGAYDKIYGVERGEFYFIHHKTVCNDFLERSNADLKIEAVFDVNGKTLYTDKGQYSFKYLIDCSGASFFLRKKLGLPLPFKYWVGETKVLDNKAKGLDKDYYYFLFTRQGFLEEIYITSDKILTGFWQWGDSVDFDKIAPPDNTFLKKHIGKENILSRHKVVIPCSPAFPLVYGNYAFLGDSHGSAVPSSSAGIAESLNSSKLLANAIKDDDLERYERDWKKKHFNSYTLSLASRIDRYPVSNFLRRIKRGYPALSKIFSILDKHPGVFLKIYNNENSLKLPKDITSLFPWYQKLFLIWHFISLRLKYIFYDLKVWSLK